MPRTPKPALFGLGSWPEAKRIGDVLRTETVGGVLVAVAALVAVVWANSPWRDGYAALSGVRVGPAALGLDLTLAQWAADGLLAVFFFVAGLELKREFVSGDLRDPRRAVLPVAAAVGGMAVPAGVYLAATWGTPGAAAGWAVPTATDIAFALAVLALVGRHLPSALRTFLLTLAVVDDLLAIVIIAVVYTADLSPVPLALTALPVAAFAVLVQRGVRSWWLLVPLAVTAWALLHASGVHATVAGVLLAFTVPVKGTDLATPFEHRWRPVSAGIAVPVFAFFAAGVTVAGTAAGAAPVTLAVALALVLGKPAGVVAATFLVQRFTRARLSEALSWWDVLTLGLLAGVGFTVSLLIGDLAFGQGTPTADQAKLGVIAGSLAAALLATIALRIRSAAHRRLHTAEQTDANDDGIPDVYQRPPT